MQELIEEGKIRCWGLSAVGEDEIRRAHAICPVTAVQNRYSMMDRHQEALFPLFQELGIALVAFSPMANGFLTAKYAKGMRYDAATDYRARMPQFQDQGIDDNAGLLKMLTSVADEHSATPAQISLAWMLAKQPWIVPSPEQGSPTGWPRTQPPPISISAPLTCSHRNRTGRADHVRGVRRIPAGAVRPLLVDGTPRW